MATKSTQTQSAKDGIPIKRKPGGQPGNQDAMRHGLRAGNLPKDAKFIEIRLNVFRRNLEAAVLVLRGEINLPDAASVQTACRWERHACLAQRWLTKQYEELKPDQRLTFSREIARASAERDKAIAALKINRDTKNDVLDALYAPATAADERDGA